MSQDLVFEYNPDMDYNSNFDKWYRWNCREKRMYREQEYTKERAFEIFSKIHPKPNLKDMEKEWKLS